MNKKNWILLTGLAAVMILWTSCNKKEEAGAVALPGNEPLTTMVLKAVNTADPTDTPTAKWAQLDPTGATPPDTTMATLVLRHNAEYNVQIQLLDSMTDITSEIKDRENYHLFCFNVATGLNLSCVQTDKDTNPTPLPIGLTDLFTAGVAGTGTVEVTLHHQPNVKDGTCSPGSIDLDATFSVKIQ